MLEDLSHLVVRAADIFPEIQKTFNTACKLFRPLFEARLSSSVTKKPLQPKGHEISFINGEKMQNTSALQ